MSGLRSFIMCVVNIRLDLYLNFAIAVLRKVINSAFRLVYIAIMVGLTAKIDSLTTKVFLVKNWLVV